MNQRAYAVESLSHASRRASRNEIPFGVNSASLRRKRVLVRFQLGEPSHHCAHFTSLTPLRSDRLRIGSTFGGPEVGLRATILNHLVIQLYASERDNAHLSLHAGSALTCCGGGPVNVSGQDLLHFSQAAAGYGLRHKDG